MRQNYQLSYLKIMSEEHTRLLVAREEGDLKPEEKVKEEGLLLS